MPPTLSSIHPLERAKAVFRAPLDLPRSVRYENAEPADIVKDLLEQAVRCGASDLHFEPSSTGLRVRFRQDGELRVVADVPKATSTEVVSRIKVMAVMDIAEKRRPQDGRIRFQCMGQSIDVRASTLPTEYGEKVVLRILDQTAVELDLAKLGIDGERRDAFERVFRLPYGMILITGPTGAGKSTTLYSVLNALRSPKVNITTVEDPIEYRLDGIVQTAVKPDIGLTFAHALRTILRQDPNVIMVGEIRDVETAQIAMRAALTGHLVLSTLHTNDAASAVTRLVDMGIEPFLVSSSVNLIVAQRLVRRLCPLCSEPDPRARGLLASMDEPWIEGNWRIPKGCAQCSGTGYKGRIGIFEVLPLTDELRTRVTARDDANRLRELAVSQGLVTLRVDALNKAKAGITSLEEVIRETCS
jgi:type II secretory ATPase GspE/PulE/Tfp pilus assembly ATPase PilB-like protein